MERALFVYTFKMFSSDAYIGMKHVTEELTPPLFAFWQCQSQAWIKEEGDSLLPHSGR